MPSILESEFPKSPVIYLDAEFTDLDAPELLSLGLVTSRGEELYVELDLDSAEGVSALGKTSDFVRQNGVLAQWDRVPGATASYPEMARRVADWLQGQLREPAVSGSGPVLIAVDFAADFDLLKRLLSETGQWDALRERVRPIDIGELTNRFDGSLAADAAYAQLRRRGIERHHALADAHALRAACIAMLTGKRVRL